MLVGDRWFKVSSLRCQGTTFCGGCQSPAAGHSHFWPIHIPDWINSIHHASQMDLVILDISGKKISDIYPMKAAEYVAKKHPDLNTSQRRKNCEKVHHTPMSIQTGLDWNRCYQAISQLQYVTAIADPDADVDVVAKLFGYTPKSMSNFAFRNNLPAPSPRNTSGNPKVQNSVSTHKQRKLTTWILWIIIGWQRQCNRIAKLLNNDEFAGGAKLSDDALPGIQWQVSGMCAN